MTAGVSLIKKLYNHCLLLGMGWFKELIQALFYEDIDIYVKKLTL